ncbi:HAMP domain-containing sensor histidine kinase [Stenotrophomonas sp. PS02289]|uniref:sensor histidine kinase n=1 Tax=Stenotrophomonas sp. PS02289 TaxID=2991422 RepID=UPI00249C079E|nr:HAMP domain-containing sensor histidine kinase [Stenotrophomonas sp. PS02289]
MTESRRRRGRSLHWWASVALIMLGLQMLLAIGVTNFSGQLLMEDRYWSDLMRSIADDHAALVKEGRVVELPQRGMIRSWYVENGGEGRAGAPAYLADLPPGIYSSESSMVSHSEFADPGGDPSYHALITALPHGRLITRVEIDSLERTQNRYSRYSALWVFCFAGVIAGFIVWLHANLVRPVHDLARRMQAMNPGDPQARLPTDYKREEIQVIASASNAHLDRVAQFIERERSLLDQASHEFRTPIAVIAGAVDVLKQQPLPAAANAPLVRIEHAVEDLSETMVALLYLAREAPPQGGHGDVTALHDLLPRLLHDHEHLLPGRDTRLQLGEMEPTFVAAPEAMIRIAASNLIRNAIENTRQGIVRIALAKGVLSVSDSGSGFDPAEAARRYRDLLRQGSPARGQGLGLFLIGRICDHFGWTLGIDSSTDGTRATLDMRASCIEIP